MKSEVEMFLNLGAGLIRGTFNPNFGKVTNAAFRMFCDTATGTIL